MYQVSRVIRDLHDSREPAPTTPILPFALRLEKKLNQLENDGQLLVDLKIGARDAIIVTHTPTEREGI